MMLAAVCDNLRLCWWISGMILRMDLRQIVEYSFFFALLIASGYLAWLLLAPFLPALALAAVVTTICYPAYRHLHRRIPGQRDGITAALATVMVLIVIVIPVFFVSTVVVNEVVSFYRVLSDDDNSVMMSFIQDAERLVEEYAPDLDIDITGQVEQAAQWFAGNIGAIFAGTAATLFLLFISIIGLFYAFRDGERFTRWLIRVSPLPDNEDEVILSRLALAVRSVVVGVVLVSIIQGVVAAVGFSLFGIERAVLWASIAAIAALLPGIGTSVIMIPAVAFLFLTGDIANGFGLMVWAIFAVIIIDSFIAPYLMSRGNKLHPFIILLSVLGGISMFGPIGFVIGPVIISLFMVLLEIYGHNVGMIDTKENKTPV